MKYYIKGTTSSVVSSSLREVLHSWWYISTKNLMGAYSSSFIETKLLRHLEKAGKTNFIAKTSQVAASTRKNVPLFYSNTNPIITTIYLTLLQHTMETICLMRHWIIRKERVDEVAQVRSPADLKKAITDFKIRSLQQRSPSQDPSFLLWPTRQQLWQQGKVFDKKTCHWKPDARDRPHHWQTCSLCWWSAFKSRSIPWSWF